LKAPPSSIILLHMNHPESETAEGVIEAIPELKKRGVRFVKLSEYGLR
jgi:peptidoglycan/xylan/chitin deacetylase (PgdA/CDA1 family)